MPSVSEPATLEEAAEALRGGSSVSIERGGGDVVLSTRRLDRVLEHEPGDLTAIVEAGLRLSELQARLEPHGQMLALDPPASMQTSRISVASRSARSPSPSTRSS